MTEESPAEKTDQLPVTKEALKVIPEYDPPPKRSPVAPPPKMFNERRKQN
jgi:hypothetical protein